MSGVGTFLTELETKIKDLASHLESDGKKDLADLEKLYTEVRPELETLVTVVTSILGKLGGAATPPAGS